MQNAKYDVIAVGNAIIDLLQTVPESFLARHEIGRGVMTLIDEQRALALSPAFVDPIIAPGGSAANTVTGLSSFGGNAAFIGKVADDPMGANYQAAFRAAGVRFDTPARPGPPASGRCLIAVTPDGQRSMSTYLGAAPLIERGDIDADLIRASALTFLEGYLFDGDEAKAAFVLASEIAAGGKRKTALSLSDKFCVDRHRASFLHLVERHIDILFANEQEIMSLYEGSTLDECVTRAAAACEIAVVTRSEKGAIIAAGAQRIDAPAVPNVKVIDTTGAGDQYAAGFLHGYAKGRDLAICGRLGALAAAEVIAHIGPRPATSLKLLAEQAGL